MYRLSDKAVLFAPPETIEPEALKQIENTASMPFIFKHVAVMPDCHYGKGATVGTVLATKGVDIGCGMVAVKTPLKRDAFKDPAALRADIERRIPMSVARSNKKIGATAAPRIAISSSSPRGITPRFTPTGNSNWGRLAAASTSSSWLRMKTTRYGRRSIPARAASAT